MIECNNYIDMIYFYRNSIIWRIFLFTNTLEQFYTAIKKWQNSLANHISVSVKTAREIREVKISVCTVLCALLISRIADIVIYIKRNTSSHYSVC